MTVATLTTHDDDAQLGRYGYRQQFVRSLRHFESFAVAFSFISITTGIFTTMAFVLGTGGPSEFRDAQYYVLGALGVGVLVYIGQWILEPGAMRTEEGAHGAEALSDTAAPATGGPPAAQ